jgi:O-methyltransferase
MITVKEKKTITNRIAKYILSALRVILPNIIYMKFVAITYPIYKKLYQIAYIRFCIYYWLKSDKNLFKRSKLTLKLLPYTLGWSKALENAYDVAKLINENNIIGNIVECGVAQGGASAMLALTDLQYQKFDRKYIMFDSFEGLPEPTEEDYKDGKPGEFIRPLPKGSCLGTLPQVKDLFLNKLNIKQDKLQFVKGWFQDTVPIYKNKLDNIAILRLDGDWYESTKIPLDNLYPLVPQGGIVIIDDYFTCYGSQKALDEYIKKHNINIDLNSDGRGGVWFEKT